MREWRYTGFTRQLYIKARETIPTGHSVKINVVQFLGGTELSSVEGEIIPDDSVASDEEMNDELDNIFNGNGTATIDTDDEFDNELDNIFGN